MTLHAVPAPTATPQEQTDRALLAKVANGDRDAFDALYYDYHRRLSRFLLRFTRHYDVAEEIINDTMFCVWQQAGDFRGRSKVSTWIMGIAFRQASNMMRGIDRARKRDNLAATEQQIQAVDSSDIDRHARVDWVSAALESLPTEQRAAVELGYMFGHSCAEIAEICACPVNTVKSRMLAARKALRYALPKLAGESDTATGTQS